MGKGDYSKVLPPNSYINVANFIHPKHLAQYLDYLIANPEEYIKYFEWRKYFDLEVSNSNEFVTYYN